MNNTSALCSVINGVYIVLGDSVCYAVWILKCYRCSSLLSLILPLVEILTCQVRLYAQCLHCCVLISWPYMDNSFIITTCFGFSHPGLIELLLLK